MHSVSNGVDAQIHFQYASLILQFGRLARVDQNKKGSLQNHFSARSKLLSIQIFLYCFTFDITTCVQYNIIIPPVQIKQEHVGGGGSTTQLYSIQVYNI